MKTTLKRACLALSGVLLAGVASAAVWTLNINPVGPGELYPYIQGYETLPMDTNLPNGAQPQQAAPTTFQVASIGAAMALHTATAVAGAATLNTVLGTVTSEALTTAAGSTYTLTLTNSTVTASSSVQAMAFLGTSTQGQLTITSITPGSGSVVIAVKNTGARALNGAIKVMFQTKAPPASN